MTVHTPWGQSQDSHKIADGITFHSTSSHGGIILSKERWAEMKQLLPNIRTFCGVPGCLEEDCDYMYAVFCWPECWSDDYAMLGVVNMLKSGHMQCVQEQMEAGNAAVINQYSKISERAERWKEANKDNWERGGMGSTKARKIWYVFFYHITTRQHRQVYMPYPRKEHLHHRGVGQVRQKALRGVPVGWHDEGCGRL